jgi:hypothetical protein
MKNLFCKFCGKEISNNSKECLGCGAPIRSGKIRNIIIAIIGFLMFLGAISSGSNATNKTLPEQVDSSPNNQKLDIVIPQEQIDFCDCVNYFTKQYAIAPNELKKSQLRIARKKKLQDVLASLRFNDWVGELTELGTTTDGGAYVSVRLHNSSIILKTWNNHVSDLFDNSIIPINTPLYENVSNLPKNCNVKINGAFRVSDEDFLKECSITEEGSMTEPEFIVNFNQILKY